jgi:hypothetical protein
LVRGPTVPRLLRSRRRRRNPNENCNVDGCGKLECRCRKAGFSLGEKSKSWIVDRRIDKMSKACGPKYYDSERVERHAGPTVVWSVMMWFISNHGKK